MWPIHKQTRISNTVHQISPFIELFMCVKQNVKITISPKKATLQCIMYKIHMALEKSSTQRSFWSISFRQKISFRHMDLKEFMSESK